MSSNVRPMQQPSMSVALGTVVALLSALAMVGPGSAAEGSIGDATPAEIADAVEHDTTLLAKGNGWTIAEASEVHRSAEIIGTIAESVAERWPGSFLGSAVSDTPGAPATLYLKGPVSKGILELVRDARMDIEIDDNHPYSLDELTSRNIAVHEALVAMGYSNVSSSAPTDGRGRVDVTLLREQGLASDEATVRAKLPYDLRDDVTITFNDAIVGSDKDSFGGMVVQANGNPLCSSGWSVFNPNTGVGGVTTAAHCGFSNEIVHPGHGTHTFAFQAQHYGQWGDVEWHTTNQFEPDDFYASPTLLRDVSAIEAAANITENEPICSYSLFAQNPHAICTARVERPVFSCTNDGNTSHRLVLMDREVLVNGDSGGPWYYGTKAYGSTKGTCQSGPQFQETFSVAAYYDEALGMTVKTSPWQ